MLYSVPLLTFLIFSEKFHYLFINAKKQLQKKCRYLISYIAQIMANVIHQDLVILLAQYSAINLWRLSLWCISNVLPLQSSALLSLLKRETCIHWRNFRDITIEQEKCNIIFLIMERMIKYFHLYICTVTECNVSRP